MGQAAELKEDIWCSGDPEQNNDPDSSLEDVVIGEQFRPRMAADKVEKKKLECHGKCAPRQPDGNGVVVGRWWVEAGKEPDHYPERQNTRGRGQLMCGKLTHVLAIGEIAGGTICY